VKYLVVGGYAVALHGHPRYTKDLEIWIELSPENAKKILLALEVFGFGSLDLKSADFLEEDQVIQIGYPPNRIDMLTTLKNVNFEECYKSKLRVIVEDVEINFINLEDLRKNKRATGRTQDLADVENLK
jgi:hypothetical protein